MMSMYSCLKKALWNRKNCYNGIKRQLSTSYKLPYVFQSPGSSPPSEILLQAQVGLGLGIDQIIENMNTPGFYSQNYMNSAHLDELDLDEISSDELYNNYFSDEHFDDL